MPLQNLLNRYGCLRDDMRIQQQALRNESDRVNRELTDLHNALVDHPGIHNEVAAALATRLKRAREIESEMSILHHVLTTPPENYVHLEPKQPAREPLTTVVYDIVVKMSKVEPQAKQGER